MKELQFYKDVIKGLSQTPKRLYSKYFYDRIGDHLFQQIMASPEYYLTNCELEIIQTQKEDIVNALAPNKYDLVELGCGDGAKSIYLIEALLKKQGGDLNYFPIDISPNVLQILKQKVNQRFPQVNFTGLAGDYFEEIAALPKLSDRPKLVLFLGSSIGNFGKEDTLAFLKRLRSFFQPGDYLFIGMDLVKDPATILAAYNDSGGYTRDFNLNLLTRINQELKGNFEVKSFVHAPEYNPQTGACRSFLKSLKKQEVQIGDEHFHFDEGEKIFMEISQKYTIKEIDKMTMDAGFEASGHFLDKKKWFLDSLWRA